MLQRVGLPYHLSRRHAAPSVRQRRDGHERVGRGRACTWGSLAAVTVSVVPPARRATPGTRRVDDIDSVAVSHVLVPVSVVVSVSVSLSQCRGRDVSLFSGQYPMFFSEVAEHANNARSQQCSQQCLNYHILKSFF